VGKVLREGRVLDKSVMQKVQSRASARGSGLKCQENSADL